MTEPQRRITIAIPATMYEQMNQQAMEEGISIEEWFRMALLDHLQRKLGIDPIDPIDET